MLDAAADNRSQPPSNLARFAKRRIVGFRLVFFKLTGLAFEHQARDCRIMNGGGTRHKGVAYPEYHAIRQ
jgi:hypothetical protein